MTCTATRNIAFPSLGGLFEEDDVRAASSVLTAVTEGGSFFPLPEENNFQNAFAENEGAKHAIAVNSCGTALDLCMMVLDIGPGDEIITTPLTFVCTATCASARGARVVFADIDPETYCLDSAAVRKKITPKTKAIIPVHFAGHACDLDGFEAITRDTGVPVIYDAAHAAGTRYKGRPVGGSGLASCYSFQSNKNMTTLGEGGAVTSNDTEFAEKVRQKKTFGYVYGGPSVRVVTQGFNYRMTKPQMATGLTQLAKLDRINGQKRERAQQLHAALQGVEGIRLPAGFEGNDHAAHLFVVQLTGGIARTELQKHLREQYQVGTAIHYPAVWTWEAFANDSIDYDASDCQLATTASENVLSLPVSPAMSAEDIDYVAWAVKQALKDLA